jgi:hypothetical protein
MSPPTTETTPLLADDATAKDPEVPAGLDLDKPRIPGVKLSVILPAISIGVCAVQLPHSPVSFPGRLVLIRCMVITGFPCGNGQHDHCVVLRHYWHGDEGAQQNLMDCDFVCSLPARYLTCMVSFF